MNYERDYLRFKSKYASDGGGEHARQRHGRDGGGSKGELAENDLRNRLRGRDREMREASGAGRVAMESSDADLVREYAQWQTIGELYGWCQADMAVRGGKQRQELTNTIQRWLIHVNERYNCVPKYEWFCLLPAVAADHPAAEFLRDALVEKRFVSDLCAAGRTTERLLSWIRRQHDAVAHKHAGDVVEVARLRLEFDRARRLIVVEQFQSEELDRVVFLVDRGGLLRAARLLLRYESFGNGSYQWGDPREVHHVLYEQFGVRFEGFASPINSRFIEYRDTRFCSLFPDTDAEFGSLGDFFHVDMGDHRGGWSVNPPFVNDLMLQVARRIEHVLLGGPHWWFFCTFPCWTDDEGWNVLNSSKFLVKRFDLKPTHYVVQNAYGDTFEPAMKMTMFVLGQIPAGMSRLTELGNILLHDYYHSHEDTCPW